MIKLPQASVVVIVTSLSPRGKLPWNGPEPKSNIVIAPDTIFTAEAVTTGTEQLSDVVGLKNGTVTSQSDVDVGYV